MEGVPIIEVLREDKIEVWHEVAVLDVFLHSQFSGFYYYVKLIKNI